MGPSGTLGLELGLGLGLQRVGPSVTLGLGLGLGCSTSDGTGYLMFRDVHRLLERVVHGRAMFGTVVPFFVTGDRAV